MRFGFFEAAGSLGCGNGRHPCFYGFKILRAGGPFFGDSKRVRDGGSRESQSPTIRVTKRVCWCASGAAVTRRMRHSVANAVSNLIASACAARAFREPVPQLRLPLGVMVRIDFLSAKAFAPVGPRYVWWL